ncbi:MAG: dTDP-glucose 4,6-dehydratase [Microgenomates group bacterium GW2011_GWA2_47_8]|nr:MAG: dTDP-glucose 4,6-dehydratase [Microgenomates group bacterium GW2011_GWA2_47_8]
MKSHFWKGKKVLVTGAGGFLGTALSTKLREEGAIVVAVSRIVHRQGIIAADVASKRKLEVLFSPRNLFACFHLAGEALVEEGKESPYRTFQNNILGTLNILELSKIYHVARVVVSSTVQVYGDAKPPTTEDIFPRPSRPYETSKTCADLIAQSYADSYHLPVLIPRFVNIYGPGDTNFSRLIPKTIRSVLFGQNPSLWGGSAIRDFLFIDDAIHAFILLAQIGDTTLDKNRIFNFGTGGVISVRDLMLTIIRLSGVQAKIAIGGKGRDQEIAEQYVNWTKAKKILGWEPTIQLSEGLLQTISWYRRYLGKE